MWQIDSSGGIMDGPHCDYVEDTLRQEPLPRYSCDRNGILTLQQQLIKKERKLWEEQRAFDQERWQFEKEVAKSQKALIDLEQMLNEFKSLRVKYLESEHNEFHCDQGTVWQENAHTPPILHKITS
jgi:hypothetical protein